jgi:hypothetical protein
MLKDKKMLSVLATIALTGLCTTAIASLFSVTFVLYMPTATWVAVTLILGLLTVGLAQRFQQQLNAKTMVGIFASILLLLGLGFGLFTSIAYLASYLQEGYVVTSFPWYWGFSYAQYFVGPIATVLGIVWLILHIREDRRNIRDARLITGLVAGAVAVWAVIDTISDIRGAILYGNGMYPWHFQMIVDILKYGAMLLALWGILFSMKRWENRTKTAESPEHSPKISVTTPSLRLLTAWDAAIVAIPAAAILLSGGLLWQTNHRWFNLGAILGNLLCVCLFMVTAAWAVAYYYRCSRRLKHLRVLGWTLSALSIAAGILWTIHFNREELYPLTGLKETMGIHFGILYFGPPALGAMLGSILIRRLEKRLTPSKESPSLSWVAVLGALSLSMVLGLGVLLQSTQLQHEAPISLEAITEEDAEHVQFQVVSDVYSSSWTFSDLHRKDENKLYFTASIGWAPFDGIKYCSYYHNLNYRWDGEITEIYVYKAPDLWVLAAKKDPETGKWHLVNTGD